MPQKDLREIEFFQEQPKKENETKKKAPEKKKMPDMFDDMMGGNSSDEVDLMDFDAPPKKAFVQQASTISDLDFNFSSVPQKRVEPRINNSFQFDAEPPTKRVEAKRVADEFQVMLNKIQKFCAK